VRAENFALIDLNGRERGAMQVLPTSLGEAAFVAGLQTAGAGDDLGRNEGRRSTAGD